MKWQPQGKRPDIGIWIELPPGSRWANEGMVRLIGFMIEGAARYTGPRFHLMVPHGLDDVVRADMRTLKATEHTDWVVHAPPTLADPTIHRNRYTRKAARLILQAEDMLQGGWLERMVAYANEHVLVDGWIASIFSWRRTPESATRCCFPRCHSVGFSIDVCTELERRRQ